LWRCQARDGPAGSFSSRRRVTASPDATTSQAGLLSDGRPVTSHGLRAGGATDLAENGATDQELEDAGHWAKGASIPRKVYVRPAQAGKKDPLAKVPVHNPDGQNPV
jgi:hypothetical protein